jgi:predicted RNase H-like HicB family nuclease
MKTKRFKVIMNWSVKDNAYIVEVPELPGCMAHGATKQLALKNAKDAITFRIRTGKDGGKEIP